jgi:hypothetical protein
VQWRLRRELPTDEPTEKKVENVIEWGKDRIATKKLFNEQCRQAEDLFLIMMRLTMKKSCCRVF